MKMGVKKSMPERGDVVRYKANTAQSCSVGANAHNCGWSKLDHFCRVLEFELGRAEVRECWGSI